MIHHWKISADAATGIMNTFCWDWGISIFLFFYMIIVVVRNIGTSLGIDRLFNMLYVVIVKLYISILRSSCVHSLTCRTVVINFSPRLFTPSTDCPYINWNITIFGIYYVRSPNRDWAPLARNINTIV